MATAAVSAVIGAVLLLAIVEVHNAQGRPDVEPTSAWVRLLLAAAAAMLLLPLLLRLGAWPLVAAVGLGIAGLVAAAAVHRLRQTTSTRPADHVREVADLPVQRRRQAA